MTYSFEYLFFSQLTEQLNSAADPEGIACQLQSTASIRASFLSHFQEESPNFDWKHFAVTHHIEKGLEYWLLQFPVPTCEPEALWGLIVHYDSMPFQYFTCERETENRYILGQPTLRRHTHYGPCSAEPDAFIKQALDLAKGKESRISIFLKKLVQE